MKPSFLPSVYSTILALLFLVACNSQPSEKATPPRPQVFTPQPETDSANSETDTTANTGIVETENEPAEVEVKRKPMPTIAELKKVTPSQEAKRALSNDAMQIYRMQPEAFFTFLKSRIPYYKGKGRLKAENDMVRIEITEKEMLIETPKGRQTFQMQ